MERIRLFYGFDPRESVGAHVFLQSILESSSLPVEAIALTPRLGKRLGISSDGSNSFSKLRFICPYLSDFKGYCIFLDGSDMLLRADLAELWGKRDPYSAVQVVKHDYKTKSSRKYLGTELEAENPDYPRKQWSSCILWNNSYWPHRRLTPEFISTEHGSYLHRFEWISEDKIGELPKDWNHLVGEQELNPEAKVAHFTLGIPGFTLYKDCEHSEEWRETLDNSQRGLQCP